VCGVHTATQPPPPTDNSRAQEEQPALGYHIAHSPQSYTVHTSCVRLDDEISTSAAH